MEIDDNYSEMSGNFDKNIISELLLRVANTLISEIGIHLIKSISNLVSKEYTLVHYNIYLFNSFPELAVYCLRIRIV